MGLGYEGRELPPGVAEGQKESRGSVAGLDQKAAEHERDENVIVLHSSSSGRGSLKATQRKVTEMRQELVNVDNWEFKNSGFSSAKKGDKANHQWWNREFQLIKGSTHGGQTQSGRKQVVLGHGDHFPGDFGDETVVSCSKG